MKRILVTGASGFLGWNICCSAAGGWETMGTYFRHPITIPGATLVRIDLTDFESLRALFHDIRPDGVVHAAANPDAEYCELHPDESHTINVDVPRELARLCADCRVPFLFTSSDLVFDGLNPPYREEDPVSPLSHYGRQKCMAESGIREVYPDATICRLPLMFGLRGSGPGGLLAGLSKAMRARKELRLFVDEYRTPVSGKTAAAGILLALGRHKGPLHLGGRERISRYEFGRLVAGTLGDGGVRLIPCRQREATTSALRPPDVSLDSSRAFAMGFSPLPLAEELARIRETLGFDGGNWA
ncbi:MAG: NAD(P)-dependent oxidoreductase [Thermodesulfobacteriota bacterium]